MVRYNIISTGSDGNATILEDFVLIDCGVPYKALEPYVPKLKLVLLTHIHSDHFQKRTIKPCQPAADTPLRVLPLAGAAAHSRRGAGMSD